MHSLTITHSQASSSGNEALWLVLLSTPDGLIPDSLVLPLTGTFEVQRNQSWKPRKLSDPSLSRHHFRITAVKHLGGLWELEDLDSKNGTFVNARRVKRHFLKSGDVIRAGDCVFTVLSAPLGNEPPTQLFPVPLSSLGNNGALAVDEEDMEWIGFGPTSRGIREQLCRVAPTTLPVLLLGETGTGKEVAARAIHRLSGRLGEMNSVNCSAVPESLFESTFFGHRKGAFTGADRDEKGLLRATHKGTLFLDEVGEMPLSAQAKLLRFLEDGHVQSVGSTRSESVDVRIVSATNAPIRRSSTEGSFRPDLLARLDGFSLELPPLRHRREDIPALVSGFASKHEVRRVELSPDATEAIVLDDWPHNVRGLVRTVQRWCELERQGDAVSIGLCHLPNALGDRICAREEAPDVPSARRRKPDRSELLSVLESCEFNIQLVARHFDKDRKQVYRWMEQYGIDRP